MFGLILFRWSDHHSTLVMTDDPNEACGGSLRCFENSANLLSIRDHQQELPVFRSTGRRHRSRRVGLDVKQPCTHAKKT